jgi:hypothetical protein
MQTYTRTRQEGTQETVAGNPADRIAAIKRIVANKQYEKIDGCMIDLYTASVISQVYDALGDENKLKFSSMPAPKMGVIAYKLISK